MTDGRAKLRTCARASLDDLKETTDPRPAWQGVDGANKGKWAWCALGAANQTEATVALRGIQEANAKHKEIAQ